MISVWFLGLQYLISRYGSGGASMPTLSGSQFMVKKVQYKVLQRAHAENLIFNRYCIQKIKEMGAIYKRDPQEFFRWRASGHAFKPVGRGASPGAKSPSARPSAIPKGLPAARPSGVPAAATNGPASLPGAPGAGGDAAGGGPGLLDEGTKQQILDLEGRLRKVEMENQMLKQAGGGSGSTGAGGGAGGAQESAAVKYMQERCKDLESQIMSMQERIKMQDYGTTQDVATLQQAHKNLTKAESENTELTVKVTRLTKQLAAAEEQQAEATTAKAAAEAQAASLRKELDNERKAANDGKAAVLEKANKDQAEEIKQLKAQVQTEKNAVERASKKVNELQELSKTEAQRATRLKNHFLKLSSKLKDLQIFQAELKSGVSVELRQFLDTYMGPMARGVKQMGMNIASMQDGFKSIQAERRRLHNMVLELKGNIRVFARVRPMSDNEHLDEPSDGTKTVQFAEETKVSVYNDYDARKKWFEFDKVFWPNSRQEDVFEEAKALATSVLDGYNVCIFAYGQTGSGKTFTMRGPKENPGLYVRVLTELFSLRDERRQSNRIGLSMMITEIYNESLRDLLSDKSQTKKVDVKLQSDGSISLTNVDEQAVKSIGDVMTAMAAADKNRAVATTDMNEYSSRSHQIVTIKTDNESLETGTQYFGTENDGSGFTFVIFVIDLFFSSRGSRCICRVHL